MATYNVFLPGQLGRLDPAKVTGGLPNPTNGIAQQAGLLIQGVTGASAAAAAAAVQAAIPGAGNQQGLMHVFLASNDTTE